MAAVSGDTTTQKKCPSGPGTMVRCQDLPPRCQPTEPRQEDCQYACGMGPKQREAEKGQKEFACYDHRNDQSFVKDYPAYPTNFKDFNWFQEVQVPDRCAELKKTQERWQRVANTLDPIPIPPILPERYPYRYTSAKPCTTSRTKKELDVRRAYLRLMPKTSNTKMSTKAQELREVTQVKGYETTTLTDQLKVFQHRGMKDENNFKSSNPPKTMNEPLFLPFKASSDFDRYVIDYLHPNWHTDPLYKRRYVYQFH